MKETIKLSGLMSLLLAGVAPAVVTSQAWKVSLDFGASFASGNTDSTLVTGGFHADRELDEDIYSLNATYSWGEEDGDTTSDSLLADASWKRLLSERAFVGLRLDGRYDNLADIDYRASLSVFAGYFFVKNETTKFSVEGGPGGTMEKVGGETSEFASLYLGEKFERQLTADTKIYQSVAFYVSFEDLDDFDFVAEAGIETKLTEHLNLKVSVEDKFSNQPAPDREENDIRVVTGVSYSF